MKIFIAYVIVAEVYELIHFYIGCRKLLKYKENNSWFRALFASLSASPNMRVLAKRVVNPFTIVFVGIPFILMLNLFIFPFSIFYLVRKWIGIKSDLEKKAEAESVAIEMAIRRNNDFMKNENMYIDPIEQQPINPN